MSSSDLTNIKKTDKEHILDNPDTYIGSVKLMNQMNLYFQIVKFYRKLLITMLDYINYLMKL